ncbi:unnamed protein product [Allacma fusca]|uniref:MARVEL domain-containing protein n=1 Tax=Allacma fusca TaxID=39272 RepID=A0A8J2M8L6_9HEXA|nr:unnamed protein product [Allacma fusca]
MFSVTANCTPNITTSTTNLTITKSIQYPFDLDQPYQSSKFHMNEQKGCLENDTSTLQVFFLGNVKSDAEFFVTTGVLTFLYSTALIAVYLFAHKQYTAENSHAPVIDFIFTVIFAVFWLSGSAAWSNGLSDLKKAADPSFFDRTLFEPVGIVTSAVHPIKSGSFGGIVISILFGFINFILWAANLWFLYKETTWFESILKNSAPSTAATTTGA